MKLLRIGLIALAVVVVGGFALYWFVIRTDAKAPPKLSATATTTPGAAGTAPDGTWSVRPGPVDTTYAGYRAHELLLRGNLDQDVTGRTNEVTGTFVIAGGAVKSGALSVKIDTLSTGTPMRDDMARRVGLESDKFPTATFELTEPIPLGAPSAGQDVKVKATGNMTIHGVTKPLTFDLDARWSGDTIEVAGTAPITLSEFGVDVGGFAIAARVDDKATIELQLTFVRA